MRISPRALTAMRTLSSSSWIDRWEGSGLVAAGDIRPGKGTMSACFFDNEGKGRGGEREEEGEEENEGSGVERRWMWWTGECMRGRALLGLVKHFHVYNPIQSQHIQYYIGDPSLLS